VKVIRNGEKVRFWKEIAVAYVEVVSQHVPRARKTMKNLRTAGSLATIKPLTSRILPLPLPLLLLPPPPPPPPPPLLLLLLLLLLSAE
jgi:hypothetical protein